MKNTEQLKKTDLLSKILEDTKASLNPLKAEVEAKEPSFKELYERAEALNKRYHTVFGGRKVESYPRVIADTYDGRSVIYVKKSEDFGYEVYPQSKAGEPRILKTRKGKGLLAKSQESELSVEDYRAVLRKVDEALNEEEKNVREKEESNINRL